MFCTLTVHALVTIVSAAAPLPVALYIITVVYHRRGLGVYHRRGLGALVFKQAGNLPACLPAHVDLRTVTQLCNSADLRAWWW